MFHTVDTPEKEKNLKNKYCKYIFEQTHLCKLVLYIFIACRRLTYITIQFSTQRRTMDFNIDVVVPWQAYFFDSKRHLNKNWTAVKSIVNDALRSG